MKPYHALVRALVAGQTRRCPSFGDPGVYGFLVRAQRRQVLHQVYHSARDGEAFDRLMDAFLDECPPTDAHPARWAIGFAEFIDRPDVPTAVRESCDYAAVCLAQSIAPDEGATWGDVRAYTHDPRTRTPRPVCLIIHRDGRGLVRTHEVDAIHIAAWGLAAGHVDADALAARGLEVESLRLAQRSLLTRMGQPEDVR